MELCCVFRVERFIPSEYADLRKAITTLPWLLLSRCQKAQSRNSVSGGLIHSSHSRLNKFTAPAVPAGVPWTQALFILLRCTNVFGWTLAFKVRMDLNRIHGREGWLNEVAKLLKKWPFVRMLKSNNGNEMLSECSVGHQLVASVSISGFRWPTCIYAILST